MIAPPSFRIDYQRQGALLRAHVIGVKGTLDTALAFWMAFDVRVFGSEPDATLWLRHGMR